MHVFQRYRTPEFKPVQSINQLSNYQSITGLSEQLYGLWTKANNPEEGVNCETEGASGGIEGLDQHENSGIDKTDLIKRRKEYLHPTAPTQLYPLTHLHHLSFWTKREISMEDIR